MKLPVLKAVEEAYIRTLTWKRLKSFLAVSSTGMYGVSARTHEGWDMICEYAGVVLGKGFYSTSTKAAQAYDDTLLSKIGRYEAQMSGLVDLDSHVGLSMIGTCHCTHLAPY